VGVGDDVEVFAAGDALTCGWKRRAESRFSDKTRGLVPLKTRPSPDSFHQRL
jgi:hypothetical protein